MENGFDSSVPAVSNEIGVAAATSREKEEIQAAIIAAKKFPRDESASYVKAMKSFNRPSMAESALYSFPRGGKTIQGPSVDCARELARCWGNIRYGVQILSSDHESVHIRGFAYDLETNNRTESEAKFSKKIQRKNKHTGVTEWIEADERDLRELVNKHGAIAVRNALLQILPPDVVDDAEKAARETMAKAARNELGTNREDTVRKLAKAFDEIGVSSEMLSGWLGRDIKLITEDEIVSLKSIFKSIRDGNSQRDEHFGAKKQAVSDLNDIITTKVSKSGSKSSVTSEPPSKE